MSDPIPCAQQGCPKNARNTTLFRVNPPGEVGVFMCRTHWADQIRE